MNTHSVWTDQCPVGGMKYMQQCTLESGILFFLLMLISSCRYCSYWSLMNFMMGCQLWERDTVYLNNTTQNRKIRNTQFYLPVLIVNLISKPWCVYDCQLHSNPFLLDVCMREIIQVRNTSNPICITFWQQMKGCLNPLLWMNETLIHDHVESVHFYHDWWTWSL